MTLFEHTEQIKRPVEHVFAVCTEHRRGRVARQQLTEDALRLKQLLEQNRA